ncbi:MAG: hypothetical protein EOP85_20790 [Verrucomicrobiaceae bacterium]|nr:MAG: hypothetical protein EOP85_20790 [Verrucomicrobiaceae bacterium]
MDPARTLGLIRTEEGKDMPHVARNLLNRWSTEDLTGLSEWTNSQTDPVMRHSGATYVMNGLAAQGEFAEAIEWAEITNPNYKNGVISSMVSQWSLKDEAAVRDWVEQSSFPEEQKNSLREMVDHTLKSNR